MSALRKVLVVDDDPVVGKSFSRVLSNKGYAVITAANAQEALGRLRNEDYDAVYTDIKMPGMDGVELAEQVRARQPWMPVVIVTGYGTADNERRAKAAGVSAFLRKPLSPEMIEDSAAQVMKAGEAATAPLPAARVVEAAAPEPATEAQGPARNRLKDLALFFAAPLIGLVYAVFLPLVGLGMLAWVGGKALAEKFDANTVRTTLKNVGMFIAAPFIGLAFIVLLPLAGAALLAWTGAKALWSTSRTG